MIALHILLVLLVLLVLAPVLMAAIGWSMILARRYWPVTLLLAYSVLAYALK